MADLTDLQAAGTTKIVGSDATGLETNPLNVDVNGAIGITVAALPLPSGAATLAAQTTGNSTLSSIDTKMPALGQTTMANSSPVVLASNQSALAVTGTFYQATQPVSIASSVAVTGTFWQATQPVSGTFYQATQPVSISGTVPTSGSATDNTANSTAKLPVMAAVASTAAPSWTNGNMVPLSTDLSGALRIAGSITATNAAVSTTGSAPPASASLTGGSVTTAAPVYTTGQMSAISLTTAGALRVDASGSTQPISGTVAATQSGTWNVTNVSGTVSLPTGAATSALQTTLNSSMSSIDTKTPTQGQTTMAASSPVVIASNQTAIPVSQSGAWAVTANAGTNLNTSALALDATLSDGSQQTRITDGVTGPVAVMPASTAPVATDKALVVILSPNQPAIPTTTTPASSSPTLAFGDIALAAITTVPVRRTTYTEQSANFQGSVVSSSALDTAAGTGARTVKIWYVDQTGATAGTETITLNGVTNVNLVTTTKCFIEKMEVVTVGSTGSNAGTITLRSGLAGGGTIIGTIGPTDNTTSWAHHYVVSGKTCNVTGILMGSNVTNSSGSCIGFLKSQLLPVANQVERQVSDGITVAGLDSSVFRAYGSQIKVTGPARVTLYVTTATGSAFNYRGSFDAYDA